jgi:hypothetical protein
VAYARPESLDQTELLTPQRRQDAAAAVVAANDDVLHFQDIDGKLDHRQTVEIGVHDDNWLRHVQDVREKYRAELESLGSEVLQHDRLCELNVVEQVVHSCKTSIVQGAWKRGQPLSVHGWIYSISDGLLRDLGLCIASPAELRDQAFRSRQSSG